MTKEFVWDGNPAFFYAGDAIIPSHVDSWEDETSGYTWCAQMPFGESGVELDLYVTQDKTYITLMSDIYEEKFGHGLRIRPYKGAIVISDWGVDEQEAFLTQIQEQFWPEVDVTKFLAWRSVLQQMPIVIHPDLRYWKPKSVNDK